MLLDAYPTARDLEGGVELMILDTVLASHGARSAEVIALTDEGTVTSVACWPEPGGRERSQKWVWSQDSWSEYLNELSKGQESHHVAADGRAFYPLMTQGLLWGAVVVETGAACPDSLAAALEPHRGMLADAVRAHS